MSVSLGDMILSPSKILYIKSLNAVVLADSHIGLEYALADEGTFIPPIQYGHMKKKLLAAVKRFDPEKIIIVGDLKHMFSQRTLQEHREVIDMLKTLKKIGIEIILVRGNHDNFIVGILERHGVNFVREYSEGGYLFIHGHAAPTGDIDTYEKVVMGHLHPTITLSDFVAREKLPVFLVGDKIVVLPAFTPLLPGFDVLTGVYEDSTYGSPLVVDVSDFGVYVIIEDKRVVNFGKISDLLDVRGAFL